jgi:spore germination protein KC
MDHAVQMGKFPNDFVGVFWSATASRGQDPFLPYVEVKQKDNVRIAGLAYFSGDRLVGITDPLEIGFYMLLKGVNPAGYTSYKRIPGTDTFVMFRATWRSVKTNVKIENGLPHFLIEAHEEGEIDEKYGKTLGLDKEAQIKAIEKQLAKGADRALKAFIQETQAKESDILGLGEYVRAKQPKYWNEHVKTAEEWHKIYRNLSIEVKTQFSIRRVGMKAR